MSGVIRLNRTRYACFFWSLLADHVFSCARVQRVQSRPGQDSRWASLCVEARTRSLSFSAFSLTPVSEACCVRIFIERSVL